MEVLKNILRNDPSICNCIMAQRRQKNGANKSKHKDKQDVGSCRMDQTLKVQTNKRVSLILKFLQLIFSKIGKCLSSKMFCQNKENPLLLEKITFFFGFPYFLKFYDRGLKHVIKVTGRRFEIHRVCNCFTFRHELKRLW